MAKLGFAYEMDIAATEKQGGGFTLLPHMNALIWVEALEIKELDDKKGYQAALTFEVVEPEEYKGKQFREWWTVLHADGFSDGKYKFGKPRFDKLGRACGVMINADTDTDDLLRKTFVIETGLNKGGFKKQNGDVTKDNNQIGKFYYSDDNAPEPTPELGVIGDGEFAPQAARPAAANNNKPAAANSNAPAGDRPKIQWGAKK